MKGKDAAKIFYDDTKFIRKGAMFSPIKKTLTGEGGVQSLDGVIHLHRKKMFMSFMNEERVSALKIFFEKFCNEYVQKCYKQKTPIVLYDEICEILTRAVCAWCEVPLEEKEVAMRSRQLKYMFDGAGSIGYRHLLSRQSRIQVEKWIERLIISIRQRKVIFPANSIINIIANFSDLEGKFLEPRIAAVELINILRPTVASAVYIVFIAHALNENPSLRERLRLNENENDLENFIQEVRRFYPFFPSAIARVCEDFEWQGYYFPKNMRTMLDLYGTNHDEKIWDFPEKFNPDRFKNNIDAQFSFIPQGGGNPNNHHGCAGELVVTELMKTATNFLVKRINYGIPGQDLTVDLTRLPAMVKSSFIIKL